MPRVSVVIPIYNAGAMAGLAIDSVMEQDFQDWEILVVNDGSHDGWNYQELCKKDPRVRYLEQPNGGPAVARNRGISESRSPFIAFLDADDTWLPSKLSRQVQCMTDHAQAVLCYTDYCRVGQKGDQRQSSRLADYRPRTQGAEFHDLLCENFVATSSALVKREALEATGLFDPDLRGPEDIDLWLRLARCGEFCFVDQVLVSKVDHAANLSSSMSFSVNYIKMLTRWLDGTRADVRAQRLIRARLRDAYASLAWAERGEGKYSSAAHAYWQSCRFGMHLGNAVRAIAFAILPGRVMRWLSKRTKVDHAA